MLKDFKTELFKDVALNASLLISSLSQPMLKDFKPELEKATESIETLRHLISNASKSLHPEKAPDSKCRVHSEPTWIFFRPQLSKTPSPILHSPLSNVYSGIFIPRKHPYNNTLPLFMIVGGVWNSAKVFCEKPALPLFTIVGKVLAPAKAFSSKPALPFIIIFFKELPAKLFS